ncbi:hypothetical protein [Ralstonia pseudosolanacearum]
MNNIVAYTDNKNDSLTSDEVIHYIKTGQMKVSEILKPKSWRAEFYSDDIALEDTSWMRNLDFLSTGESAIGKVIKCLSEYHTKEFAKAGIKFNDAVFSKNAIDIAPYRPQVTKLLLENGAKECVTAKDREKIAHYVEKYPDRENLKEIFSIIDEELKSRPALEPHSLKDKILELREKFIGNKNTNSIKHKID